MVVFLLRFYHFIRHWPHPGQSFVKEHGNAMMAMAFSVKPPEGVEADERPAPLGRTPRRASVIRFRVPTQKM